MRYLGSSALAVLALLLPACSGSSGDSAGGSAFGNSMFILTCSLGCPSGAGGQEVHCTPISIAPNQEIVITFSQHVDPDSVTSETFNIIDTFSGATPLGTRLVDPIDPRRVIFRPAITFDSQGNPTFGFTSGASYSIVIRGTAQDPVGPYIRSTSGKPNASRMSCQMATTSTPVDYVPGAPSVSVLVDLANTATPNDPNDIIPNQDAEDAVNVWHNSTIRMVFDDIMNPVTLANQATHQATFVTIKVDVDGILATTADQVTLTGTYVVTVNLNNLSTLMTFTSSTGMPSSGDPDINPLPRLVLVTYPAGIQDLAGNALSNAGSLSFIPEGISHEEVTLPDDSGENFNNTAFHQTTISSGTWGSGRLTRGYGGGSGRLGQLTVQAGTPVVLNTDSQLFPLNQAQYPNAQVVRDLLDNAIPGVDYVANQPATWPTITVTDGIFEFSSLTIEANATLRFSGNDPARVLVRGPVEIQGTGTLDVSGASALPVISNSASGGAGGIGGPNAGAGGDGGDRFDHTGHPTLLAAGAIANPGANPDGSAGGAVGQGILGQGAAPGGAHFPELNLPITNAAPVSMAGGLCWTFDELHWSSYTGCMCLMPGRPGGGATYGDGTIVVGGPGVPATPMPVCEAPINGPNAPGITKAGDGILIEPPDPESGHLVRTLDADLGLLRGGAGGGGGGLSLFGTETSQTIFGLACGGASNVIPNGTPNQPGYQDNSGAGGGGGGGAVQVVSGSSILLDGVIDARGGAGAGADLAAPSFRTRQATPGGGGTGGAVRVQAPLFSPAPLAGRINVTGGAGGITDLDHRTGAFVTNTNGGAGSSGLVRIEDSTGTLTRINQAPWVLPFDPNDPHPQSGFPESEDFLSVGTWALPDKRPETFTASASCWMQPAEAFFVLGFIADDLGNPDPDLRYGWNMDVVYDTGGGEQLIAYRGPDPNLPFPSGDFESNLGNTLNHGLPVGQGSYFAIRFQGAKSKFNISNQPCDVNLYGTGSEIFSNTLTPWVRHPADLNAFVPRPDMVRFCVIFDSSLVTTGSVGSFIQGVTNLKIRVQPD